MNVPASETKNFNITYLSSSPDGFDLTSDGVLGKTEGDHPPLHLDDVEKDQLRDAMKSEMEFQGAEKLRQTRREWRDAIKANAPAEVVSELGATFRVARQSYHERGKKLGMRAIHLTDEDTLSGKFKIVHFPTYLRLATHGVRPEMKSYASAATASMSILTADQRLLIQHRGITKARITKPGFHQGNATYADIPGASAAGHLDASMRNIDRKRGTPDVVNKASVIKAIAKEVEEEIGIDASQLQNIRIAGLAENKVKPHDEFLLISATNLTAKEVHEASLASTKNKNLSDADFDERFIDIEASPEAISVLLGKVKCPLAPTHVALLVATGYNLELQRSDKATADLWKDRISKVIAENYDAINEQVRNFYDKNPEVLDQVPERYWGKHVPKRDPNAYDPAYGPEEQGLPSFENEMIRTGLLPETRRHIEKAYLLDVDGVITDPIEKRITNEAIIDALAEKLNIGEVVGLNSGRSTAWIESNVLPYIVEKVMNPDTLQNLIIIGEKGGTWTTFDENGVRTHDASPKLVLPTGLQGDITSLMQDKYADSMFVGDLKSTMVSIEMRDGYDLSEFRKRQAAFANEAQFLLQDLPEWKIDETTIATDFENIHVGKDLGADRFLEFLKARGITAGHVETFGDSASDIAMADELARRNVNTTFNYVGQRPLGVTKEYAIRIYGEHTDGTARALRELHVPQ